MKGRLQIADRLDARHPGHRRLTDQNLVDEDR